MDNKWKKMAGQRLQLLRMERNLTQEQMSEKLHLSTSAYCKIEYGETDLTLTRLHQLADILDMPATRLFAEICGYDSPETAPDPLGVALRGHMQLIEQLGRRIDIMEQQLKRYCAEKGMD